MPLVNNIKILRVQLELKAKDLAEATGLSRHQISRIENGHMIPNVYDAQRIAQALRNTVEHVFPLKDSPPH